jgi:hypothetical protein
MNGKERAGVRVWSKMNSCTNWGVCAQHSRGPAGRASGVIQAAAGHLGLVITGRRPGSIVTVCSLS